MTDTQLSQMGHFTGTEQYHSMGPIFKDIVITDGVKYIMDNGYSWFVIDSLCVIVNKLRNHPFLTVQLKLLRGDAGIMLITDGNENELYTQRYGFTDAEVEVKLFFTDNVMMLPSEY
jgi:hypothetical protein